MRVALLTVDWASTGGISTYIRLLAGALDRAGHDVLVLHSGASGPPPEGRVRVQGLPHVFRDHGPGRNARGAEVAAQHLEAFRPDVVHLHDVANVAVTRRVGAWPHLRTAHMFESCPSGTRFHYATGRCCAVTTGAGCLPRMVFRRCTLSLRPHVMWNMYAGATRANAALRQVHHVIAASTFVRDVLVADGVDARRASVVPYFTPPIADGPPADPGTVLFVGRLAPEKGCRLLLDALARLSTDWRLIVVGDGIEAEASRRHAATIGVAERVNFRGWLDPEAVSAAYRSAAVVAVPSRWPEPFGIVGLEALAHGRPVVAFRTGGIPEWLTDGEHGLLAPPGDVAALAACLDRLLGDATLARRMGERGRDWVRSAFTEASHLAALIPLYERVASGR